MEVAPLEPAGQLRARRRDALVAVDRHANGGDRPAAFERVVLIGPPRLRVCALWVRGAIETRLRRGFKTCAYCARAMKAHRGVRGCPSDKATIEHLNREGPFRWSAGLQERDLVIACARCNSSRGKKRPVDWFTSPYCVAR